MPQENEREVCANTPASFVKIESEYEEITPPAKETAHNGIIQSFANVILHGEPLLAQKATQSKLHAAGDKALSGTGYSQHWSVQWQ